MVLALGFISPFIGDANASSSTLNDDISVSTTSYATSTNLKALREKQQNEIAIFFSTGEITHGLQARLDKVRLIDQNFSKMSDQELINLFKKLTSDTEQ